MRGSGRCLIYLTSIKNKKNFFALRALKGFGYFLKKIKKKISPAAKLYFLRYAKRQCYLMIFSTGLSIGCRMVIMRFIFSGVKSVGRQRTRAWIDSAIGAIFGL